ncbi:MAG TPA: methyltransferase domain-containing protein [Nitrospiria bacterium]|nr:methyltransferase domain-containing protein [Nitrospiria bacterium]
MDIKELKKHWDDLSKTDPLWAILTEPDKKGNRWSPDEFFETGRKEIDALMNHVGSLGIRLPRNKALDFGCGVGRLTQPLAEYFNEVWGVDIAAPMIDRAREYNTHGVRCRYILNDTVDLKRFPNNEFDLIYTNITLQHIGPDYTKNYLSEFLRVLSPQGLLIFQLPSHPATTLKGLIIRMIPASILDTLRAGGLKALMLHSISINQPRLQMHGIRMDEVVRFLKEHGANVVDIQSNQNSGKGWVSYQYSAIKMRPDLLQSDSPR